MEDLTFNHGNINGSSNHTNNFTNVTGNTEKLLELEAFKIIFETIVALLGIIGNIAVCVVITQNRKKRSSTEYLLRNLAIADLGVLMIIFPLAIIKEKMPFHWPFGKFTCLYLYPITETFYGVSVWTIVSIAVERYRHLFNPIKRGRQRALKNAKRLAAGIWIGSFLVFSAPTFAWIEFMELGEERFCHLYFKDPKVQQVYILMLFFLWYAIPVSFIVWTYIAISVQLHRSNIFLKTMNRVDNLSREISKRRNTPFSGTQKRRLQQNKKVKKILTPVVLAFSITMMPVNIFRVVILYWHEVLFLPSYPLLIYVVALCVVVNSSINPLIYCFVSRGIRAGMIALFKGKAVKGISFMGDGVRSLKERISLKMRRSKLSSVEEEGNLELKQRGSQASKKSESGSPQTLPDRIEELHYN
ncbi:neuropeptide Y receptor type 6-like [Actinia tenebrosa]|uniref:Neuropeptide Y receptor type 6-like n=1 Tax=Actinia tenebrosa TaxID=6105 RepID=A0A6P8HBS1_ACTTE|nr:neuropeptide Y receptor type 6-like [Actinia tenebrosa]XP_031553081.1 neuropeptide Y receptor type 6-like [Actinia tenebrosa]XP_031553086.1 neuropeptide Y receptor type 6-like [Actinia tenebrosa]XP_031553090.1 neuropeptide Y receptor type 6-like [Actinia tenebrosa]XP_031553098.1 neuropeptide Y receptor type 6-like [Actinia tenebrosa]